MNIVLQWTIVLGIAATMVLVFFRLLRIVPEQHAYVVEQFGKYQKTLGPGLHMVIPVLQKVAYELELREEVIDVPPQTCITNDNVQVEVDGILYLRVVDPYKAAYGIDDYRFATSQLAQTTMRSEIGKIELDKSFSERDAINNAVVEAVDEASDPWGIKVTRYEIKDITPTATVLEAMESQVRAEREKRGEILESEGERESRINVSRGERQEAINLSEGDKQKRINESDGRAEAIGIIASATAEGIAEVAKSIQMPKGKQAVSLRIADQFIQQLGGILDTADTSVLPLEVAQIRSLIDSVAPGLGGQADRAGIAGRPDATSPAVKGSGSGPTSGRNPRGGLTGNEKPYRDQDGGEA